jgi:hypothetical protein
LTKKKIEHIILVMEDPFSDRLGMATNRQERLPRIGRLKESPYECNACTGFVILYHFPTRFARVGFLFCTAGLEVATALFAMPLLTDFPAGRTYNGHRYSKVMDVLILH